MSTLYEQRGVSASKEDVHQAIKKLDKGIFPKAFCKILPDFLGNDPDFCNVMHADGAGTKSSLAYMYWKETGDLSVWKGIAQDAIVMNLDDLLCVGITGPMLLSSTIGRNKRLIPGEVIAEIINGTQEFLDLMADYDVQIQYAGGETADLGDLVRTVIVDSSLTARCRREEIISNHQINASNVIVGLASFGKAKYENQYNSGIGSNGLTAARHELFQHKFTEKYPESFDPGLDKRVIYTGQYDLTETIYHLPNLPISQNINVAKLALSPTRTYAPLMKSVLKEFRPKINGMVHCSGGGQTKALNFVENKHIIKDHLFEVPPLFQLIQQENKMEWKEMFRVFNMGHRMEIYTDESTADAIIQLAAEFQIDARIVGRVEEAEKNQLTILGKYGEFVYE